MPRQNKPYQVILEIGQDGKGIPYGGRGEPREDGDANHGFKNLKGNLHRIADVPEAADDPVMRAILEAINRSECGLVSVGCANWEHSEEGKHRRDGYIEFAINSAQTIDDARPYFPIFFRFDKMLRESGFEEAINYRWELACSHFWPANVDGFTCTVWVYTPWKPTRDDAKEAWQRGLAPLINLGSYPVQEGDPLFTADTDAELR